MESSEREEGRRKIERGDDNKWSPMRGRGEGRKREYGVLGGEGKREGGRGGGRELTTTKETMALSLGCPPRETSAKTLVLSPGFTVLFSGVT
jgi:hypothetical protein